MKCEKKRQDKFRKDMEKTRRERKGWVKEENVEGEGKEEREGMEGNWKERGTTSGEHGIEEE